MIDEMRHWLDDFEEVEKEIALSGLTKVDVVAYSPRLPSSCCGTIAKHTRREKQKAPELSIKYRQHPELTVRFGFGLQ